jgi:hypothetical protein
MRSFDFSISSRIAFACVRRDDEAEGRSQAQGWHTQIDPELQGLQGRSNSSHPPLSSNWFSF